MSSALRFTHALLALAALAILAACGTSTSGSPQSMTSAADIEAAKAAALTLFVKVDTNRWAPCPTTNNYAACPLSKAVRDRLAALDSTNYFYSGPSGHCAGDFISNSTNGLPEPKVVSALADTSGHVTVVIDRVNTLMHDLTAVMSKEGDRWVAIDLASGSGPNASIFATNPNC